MRIINPRPWLRELREASGMTQERLAQRAGVTPQALWLFETGQRTPGLQVAFALADILGFDARRFLDSVPA